MPDKCPRRLFCHKILRTLPRFFNTDSSPYVILFRPSCPEVDHGITQDHGLYLHLFLAVSCLFYKPVLLIKSAVKRTQISACRTSQDRNLLSVHIPYLLMFLHICNRFRKIHLRIWKKTFRFILFQDCIFQNKCLIPSFQKFQCDRFALSV